MTESYRWSKRERRVTSRFASWTAPRGWSRLVVWVSPNERKALKICAAEADTTVAQLVRGLAKGLTRGVVSPRSLLSRTARSKRR